MPSKRQYAIRDARSADADAIATIYNQGIEDRVATLETLFRSADERAEWLAARGPRHPVLVAISSDTESTGEGDASRSGQHDSAPEGADALVARAVRIVGWASLNQFNPRPAYAHVADLSVYVERTQRGQGIGDLLLGALAERATSLGYHKLVLAAFPTNARGMRLYERHGFRTVGVYREQGLLDGQWVDVIVMEKLLHSA